MKRKREVEEAERRMHASLAPFNDAIQERAIRDAAEELLGQQAGVSRGSVAVAGASLGSAMRATVSDVERARKLREEIAALDDQAERCSVGLASSVVQSPSDATPALEQLGWSSDWSVRAANTYRNDKAMTDDCVAAYLDACAGMCKGARGGPGFQGIDGIDDDGAVQLARLAWAQLRIARVFAIGPDGFGRAFRAAHAFVAGIVGEAIDLHHGGDQEGAIRRYIEGTHRAAEHAPFPDPLPFDSVFLSYGRALRIDDSPAIVGRVRMAALRAMHGLHVHLYGHLLTVIGDRPCAFTLTGFATPDGKRVDGDIGVIGTYNAVPGSSGWDQPMTMDPWVLSALVRAINATKTAIESRPAGLGARLDRARASKAAGEMMPLPSPYYLVRLKDAVIDEAILALPRPPRDWSHRWDVRGHECVRVARGKLPLAPKDKAKLEQRGYRIYEDVRSVTGEDAERLRIRGLRRGEPDEWVAVLSYWRDAFVKGPKDRPYVPAVRA